MISATLNTCWLPPNWVSRVPISSYTLFPPLFDIEFSVFLLAGLWGAVRVSRGIRRGDETFCRVKKEKKHQNSRKVAPERRWQQNLRKVIGSLSRGHMLQRTNNQVLLKGRLFWRSIWKPFTAVDISLLRGSGRTFFFSFSYGITAAPLNLRPRRVQMKYSQFPLIHCVTDKYFDNKCRQLRCLKVCFKITNICSANTARVFFSNKMQIIIHYSLRLLFLFEQEVKL